MLQLSSPVTEDTYFGIEKCGAETLILSVDQYTSFETHQTSASGIFQARPSFNWDNRFIVYF